MLGRFSPLVRGAASAAAAAASGAAVGAWALGFATPVAEAEPYHGAKMSTLRETDYPIPDHYHGKWRVKVLKVRRPPPGVEARHDISEYMVRVWLWSDDYEKVYTKEDNADLVATDTTKNTVYIVAKRTPCETPEQFGIDICTHFLTEYPVLQKVMVEVDEKPWTRAVVNGEEHDHSFVLGSNEFARATVEIERTKMGALGKPSVVSSIQTMTVLKTTQSGFTGYLQDQYTLLPETEERCVATELCAEWTFMKSDPPPNYAKVRKTVREQLKYGIFGPARGGVYSASLQATVYDAGCLVLDAAPHVKDITIFTPNQHYLPARFLDQLTEKFEDDVFVPTSEPSGTICCRVARTSAI